MEPYSISPARYSKDNFIVRCPSPDVYKTRAARLIGDGLKCRYTGRENGYVASASKVRKFERLYAEGWDASVVTGELYRPFLQKVAQDLQAIDKIVRTAQLFPEGEET